MSPATVKRMRWTPDAQIRPVFGEPQASISTTQVIYDFPKATSQSNINAEAAIGTDITINPGSKQFRGKTIRSVRLGATVNITGGTDGTLKFIIIRGTGGVIGTGDTIESRTVGAGSIAHQFFYIVESPLSVFTIRLTLTKNSGADLAMTRSNDIVTAELVE